MSCAHLNDFVGKKVQLRCLTNIRMNSFHPGPLTQMTLHVDTEIKNILIFLYCVQNIANGLHKPRAVLLIPVRISSCRNKCEYMLCVRLYLIILSTVA